MRTRVAILRVTQDVKVWYESAFDLRKAELSLIESPPHKDMSAAGHDALGRGYSYSVKTTGKNVVVRRPPRAEGKP